jgi:hypothetical protein
VDLLYVKCIYNTLTDIHQFLHVCGSSALPEGTDLGLVLREIRVDKSVKRNPMKFKVDY